MLITTGLKSRLEKNETRFELKRVCGLHSQERVRTLIAWQERHASPHIRH